MVNCKLQFVTGNVVADEGDAIGGEACFHFQVHFPGGHPINIQPFRAYYFQQLYVGIGFSRIVDSKPGVGEQAFHLPASFPQNLFIVNI